MSEKKAASDENDKALEAVHKVVVDELKREYIRKILRDGEKETKYAALLRHPLTILFSGFLLTAVAGSGISTVIVFSRSPRRGRQ